MAVSLTGCGLLPERWGGTPAVEVAEPPADATTDVVTRPQTRPEAGAGDPSGSAENTGLAAGAVGRTTATLGDASEPGLWLKTPLVQVQGPGRIVDPATGNSVMVTLIPIAGPATAGSRLSLQAMLALGVPLTDIVDVDVAREG